MSNKQINLSDFSAEQNLLEDDLLTKIKGYNNFININFDKWKSL